MFICTVPHQITTRSANCAGIKSITLFLWYFPKRTSIYLNSTIKQRKWQDFLFNKMHKISQMATDFGSSQNLGNTACLLKTNPYEETEEAKEKPKGMRRETQGKEELTSYTATLSRMMLDKGGQSPRRKTLQKATNLLRLAESMSQVISLSKESNRALLTGIPLSISMRRKNERMTPETSNGLLITAQWTAAARARETERPDALFSDPWAAQLAGEGTAWLGRQPSEAGLAPVLRTRFFDDLISQCLQQTTINRMSVAGSTTR